MAMQTKAISLTDLAQHLRSCFDSAVSGNIIRITDADQEVILVDKDTFLFMVDCLQRYLQLCDR